LCWFKQVHRFLKCLSSSATMPLPAGYDLTSLRDLSCVYIDESAAEHTVTDDDTSRLTGLQLSVHPARKFLLTTAPFLAIAAILGALLTYRSSAHTSSGSEDLELIGSQNDTPALAPVGTLTMRNMTDSAEDETITPIIRRNFTVSTTTTTTTTTTKWYPDEWWLEHVFEADFSELCASANELMAPLVRKPALGGENLSVKILTYNLFWWRLFNQLHGRGGSAGKLIAASNAQGHFDIVAFQECQDKNRVMRDAGLSKYYQMFDAPYGKCVGYRKDAWELLDNGHGNITADVYWNDYGMRGAQWLRLGHKKTGHKVFFMNYHGGLSVNSGGVCGGPGAARNLLKLMNNHSRDDDKVILVGDFNSNPASRLVQELRTRLLHVYSGSVLGGIDNILTNLPASSVVGSWNLGNAGSDHDALTTVFNLGAVDPDLQKSREFQEDALKRVQSNPPKYDWQQFWCGLSDNSVEYIVVNDSSTWHEVHSNVSTGTPDRCCRACQEKSECNAWMFHGIGGSKIPPRCVMTGGVVASKVRREGVVSGLPFQTAATVLKASLNAIPTAA